MLAIELYRDATGAPPDALADLVPEYLESVTDPISGLPFGYKRRESELGYFVWSPFADGIDDRRLLVRGEVEDALLERDPPSGDMRISPEWPRPHFPSPP